MGPEGFERSAADTDTIDPTTPTLSRISPPPASVLEGRRSTEKPSRPLPSGHREEKAEVRSTLEEPRPEAKKQFDPRAMEAAFAVPAERWAELLGAASVSGPRRIT